MRAHFMHRGLILAGVVLASQFAVSPYASASDCDIASEQVLFVRSSTFPVFGTQGSIVEADRTLASNCQNQAENHHTAHVRDSAFSSWAEVGYEEYWGTSSSHSFRIFWEVGIGTNTYGGFNSGVLAGCCQTLRFRVVNVPENNNWKFFYASATGNFIQIGPSAGQAAGFHIAWPMAEVGRRGDPGTSAGTNQSNLLYKTNRSCTTNCWNTAWSSNFVHGSTCIPGWVYNYIAADHWRTTADSSHTC